MASPQKENGYTAIANELYEAIARWKFSSYEFRVLIFIIRKTYGWNKKDDWISLSQFVEATNINRPNVCRTLRMLIKQNVITKKGSFKEPRYSIQKDYEKWELLPVGERSHHETKVIKGDNEKIIKGDNEVVSKGIIQVVSKGTHTKETITKEILQKKIATPGVADDINQLIDSFKEVNPSYRQFFSNKTQRACLERLTKLHGTEQVRGVINILCKTNTMPYVPQITTPYQLEQKWASLANALIKKKQELQKVNVFKV